MSENFKMEEVFDEYMIEIYKEIELLPRIAKFNFGEKLKESIFEIKLDLTKLQTLNKIDRLHTINLIDANVNTNRVFLRYMVSFGYLKKSKMLVIMEKLNNFAYFVGKYLNYAKNDKK